MTNKESLISVIVPIYKVEEYLDECVKSIVSQTYKNLEIILVDDGSPDNCPQMCDKWARVDERIRVIHKKNGGLSSARNAGIKAAKGDYIGFVDSDDFIDKCMYESLICGFYKNPDVGVVSCMIRKYENGVVSEFISKWTVSEQVLIPASKVAKELLSCNRNFTVWSKLYRKDVIGDVLFQEGKLNEDTLFVFDLSKRIESLGVSLLEIPIYGYYYRQRSNSICSNVKRPLDLDTINNYWMMKSYYEKTNNVEMIVVVEKDVILRSVNSYNRIFVNPQWNNLVRKEIKNNFCKIKLRSVYSYYGIKMLIKVFVIKYCSFIYDLYLKCM